MDLSIDEIINGKNKATKFTIEALSGEVYLRPLTQEEISTIKSIESEGFGTFQTEEKAKGSRKKRISEMVSRGEISVKDTQVSSDKAKTNAVLFSLSNDHYNEDWTEEKVNKIEGPAFKEIYEIVKEISGLSEDEDLEEEIDEFPENE